MRWKQWAGLLFLLAAAVVFAWLNRSMPRLALFWLLGLAFGFILQRSRFCFVSAISNFVLFRDGRLIKGLLAGLALATLGFAAVMYPMVPDPSSGAIPLNAYVAPLGWHLVLAGVLFGLGMVIAGGCIMGNLYRLGEGSLAALIALAGILAGLGLLQFSWPMWWQGYVSGRPQVWLPAFLGWPGAIAVTLAIITAIFVLVRRFESRGKNPSSGQKTTATWGNRLTAWYRNVFINAWPLSLGGIILALLNILEYKVLDRPWGITGEMMRWAEILFNAIRLPLPPLASVPGT